MAERKRRKQNSSSGSEEKKGDIDWAKKYFKLNDEFHEKEEKLMKVIQEKDEKLMKVIQEKDEKLMKVIQEKDEKLMKVIQEKDEKLMKVIQEKDEKLMKVIQEKDEKLMKVFQEKDEKLMKVAQEKEEKLMKMIEDNAKLEIHLKYANDEILRMNSMLSARGVIKWFERKHQMPNCIRQDTVRSNRWSWIFNKDSSFRQNVDTFFGYQPSDHKVTSIVDKIFCNASADIHSFNKSKGLQVSSVDYTTDELNILQSICETIPCNISIE